MRLIDADLVLETCNSFKGIGKMADVGIELINNIVGNAPTVDAERHGYWEALYAHEEPTSNVYRCSNCGKGFADFFSDDYDDDEYPVFFEYDICPHCGAIMDGETEYPPYMSCHDKYVEYWEKKDEID